MTEHGAEQIQSDQDKSQSDEEQTCFHHNKTCFHHNETPFYQDETENNGGKLCIIGIQSSFFNFNE